MTTQNDDARHEAHVEIITKAPAQLLERFGPEGMSPLAVFGPRPSLPPRPLTPGAGGALNLWGRRAPVPGTTPHLS